MPIFFSAILCYWLPESARFNLSRGRIESATQTLNEIALANKKSLPLGQLAALKIIKRRGEFKDLFSKENRLHTIVLWIVWFTNSFCYYGILLLTTEMFQTGNACEGI